MCVSAQVAENGVIHKWHDCILWPVQYEPRRHRNNKYNMIKSFYWMIIDWRSGDCKVTVRWRLVDSGMTNGWWSGDGRLTVRWWCDNGRITIRQQFSNGQMMDRLYVDCPIWWLTPSNVLPLFDHWTQGLLFSCLGPNSMIVLIYNMCLDEIQTKKRCWVAC